MMLGSLGFIKKKKKNSPSALTIQSKHAVFIFSQSGAKLKQIVTWRTRISSRMTPVACFPALCTSCTFFIRVLIGSLRYHAVCCDKPDAITSGF